jgi:hypothetical protein
MAEPLDLPGEEWRPCPDFEHWYEVSSFGRVRSHARGSRVLFQGRDSSGYPTVAMNKGGRRSTKTVHRLVCRAFHGEPIGDSNEAAHLDGNRTNPRADNLAWATKVENHSHMQAHGTQRAGERHPRAKLTWEDVRQVRALPRPLNMAAIGRRYGVHETTIRQIITGERWREDAPTPSPETHP